MTTKHSSSSSNTKRYNSVSPFVTTQNTNPLIHSAFIISNITNIIKITLSIEKGQYNTWYELFKIHAHFHQVIDHIISSKPDHLLISKTSILLSRHILMLLSFNEFMAQFMITFSTPLLSAIQPQKMRGTNYSTFFMITKILGLSS